MTVAELIEKLRALPPDAAVYVDGDRGPYDPDPRYLDWGNPASPDRGVYL